MNNATKIIEAILSGTMFAWCNQCQQTVQREDYAAEVGICNACLNDSYAEADRAFAEMQRVGTYAHNGHE